MANVWLFRTISKRLSVDRESVQKDVESSIPPIRVFAAVGGGSGSQEDGNQLTLGQVSVEAGFVGRPKTYHVNKRKASKDL